MKNLAENHGGKIILVLAILLTLALALSGANMK